MVSRRARAVASRSWKPKNSTAMAPRSSCVALTCQAACARGVMHMHASIVHVGCVSRSHLKEEHRHQDLGRQHAPVDLGEGGAPGCGGRGGELSGSTQHL